MDERQARFCLNAAGVLSPPKQNLVLQHSHSALKFFENPHRYEAIFKDKKLDTFLKKVELLQEKKSYERLLDSGVHLLLRGDHDYPENFEHIHEPPHLLYLRGQMPKPDLGFIAIIGTRRPSLYGRQQASRFAAGLAEAGWAVVSGVARGIDGSAMDSAIKMGAGVVGFLGSGIDVVYPSEHKPLYDAIAKQGALISEYPPGSKPLRHHFPWRNRLISGLSEGVLVVEAGIRSGTLVTVNWALDQGKDVFAIPGSVSSGKSTGCHHIIKDGAHLVEDPMDIVKILGHLVEPKTGLDKKALNKLTLSLGVDKQARSLDELGDLSGIEELSLSITLMKEVALGHIKKLPGPKYCLSE